MNKPKLTEAEFQKLLAAELESRKLNVDADGNMIDGDAYESTLYADSDTPATRDNFTQEIEIHNGCNAEVVSMGEDGLSYCTECEHICEGETKFISVEEFEGLQ